MNSRLLPSALILLALFPSCSEKETSSYLAPPSYQTFHNKKHGAFFQIRHGDDFYIASSIHQGGAAKNAAIFRAGQKSPVILKKRAHLQKDLHLWTYDPSTLPQDDALPYRSDIEIRKGDRIFILNKGQKIAATVSALPEGEQFRHSYQSDAPFPAGGMSGSPVFLPRAGSVIGVLQTANHKKSARFGGFEKINLP